jgi:hypothetical protein
MKGNGNIYLTITSWLTTEKKESVAICENFIRETGLPQCPRIGEPCRYGNFQAEPVSGLSQRDL